MRGRLSIVLFVVALALVGCGDDDDDGGASGGAQSVNTTTGPQQALSKAEYIEAADSICERTIEEGSALYPELETAIRNRDVEQAVDTVAELIAIGRRAVDEVEALPTPPEDAALIKIINDLRRENLARLEDMKEALQARGAEGQFGDVVSKRRAVGVRLGALLDLYGFKCEDEAPLGAVSS